MRISPWVLHPTRLLVPTLGIWLPLNAQVNWRSPESLQPSSRNVSSASGQALVVTANPLASDAAIRTLKQGGSEHSFGIHVAKMAGVPKQIVKRAEKISL